jgi:hypothetical protein
MGRKCDMLRREMTSVRGEAAPKRGKGGNDTSWAGVNFTGPKNNENSHGRFSWYKWTVKI